MIPAPIITYPKTNWSLVEDNNIYYTDILNQVIFGEVALVPENTKENDFVGVEYRYRFSEDKPWSKYTNKGISLGVQGEDLGSVLWYVSLGDVVNPSYGSVLYLEFRSYVVREDEIEGEEIKIDSDPSSIIVSYVKSLDIRESIYEISGVSVRRYSDKIKILVPEESIMYNEDSDFIGCFFYMSTTPGGGDKGYILMNDIPVTDIDESESTEILLSDSEYEDSAKDLIVTTTKKRQIVNNYYTFYIDKSIISKLIVSGKLRDIYLTDGQTISPDTNFYITVTARVFNTTRNQVVESNYSKEMEASFLTYSNRYKSLPKRSRSDVVLTMSKELLNNNELATVVPGSVIRDISDPISYEFEKNYIIQDFIFTCLSVKSLLRFDDEDNDGVSDPVGSSIKKSQLAVALGIRNPISLQMLIDEQFDKHASNYGIVRNRPSKSMGRVTFFTELRPRSDIVIRRGQIVSTESNLEEGVFPTEFKVLETKTISSDNADFYYNPSNRRYEVTVDIESINKGSDNNVPARSITVTNLDTPSLRVENSLPTSHGSDMELNRHLADKIEYARVAFDSGTTPGYISTVYNIPGVSECVVVEADSKHMMRDYDELEDKHLGGMVDIYARGVKMTQVEELISFNYEFSSDRDGNRPSEVFLIENALDFRVRSLNEKVDIDNPITSVSRVYNVTRKREYNLDSVTIVGDTIVLDKNSDNVSIGMASMDVVEVNYVYRTSDSIVLSNQPVESIVRVHGSDGSIIDPGLYELVRLDPVFNTGGSTLSRSAIRFLFEDNGAVPGEDSSLPELVEIVDEEHILTRTTESKLRLKGVHIRSIKVYPIQPGSKELIKDVDYKINPGSNTEYTYITLIQNGMIRHGDRVRVSYNANENFSVTYIYNSMVEQIQEKIDKVKHACADVLVKESIRNFVDFGFRVKKEDGVDEGLLREQIKQVLIDHTSKVKMGESLTQGVVSSLVRELDGVKEVYFPFTKMMKRNGSFIPLEELESMIFEIYHSTSKGGYVSYRSTKNALKYKTSENGGDSNLFRGIYEDGKLLEMVSSPAEVSSGRGKAYIQSDGRIIVSTVDGKPPYTKKYKASYYTFYGVDEDIVEDIETSPIEYLNVDMISFRDVNIY